MTGGSWQPVTRDGRWERNTETGELRRPNNPAPRPVPRVRPTPMPPAQSRIGIKITDDGRRRADAFRERHPGTAFGIWRLLTAVYPNGFDSETHDAAILIVAHAMDE